MIFFIVYILSIYIETKKLKKKKLSVWDNNNFMIMMIVSAIPALAVFCLKFSLQELVPIILGKNKTDFVAIGFLFCMLLGGAVYIMNYIKGIIYNCISDDNKSYFYRKTNTLYK